MDVEKTKNPMNDENDMDPIKVSGVGLPRTHVFKYLGLTITSNEGWFHKIN